MSTLETMIALAADHDLALHAEGATVHEAGLDYRVLLAEDGAGTRWVLRQPRRPDVSAGMDAEVRILDLVSPVLSAKRVAVPDWQVRSPDLIAYPALPGSPGLTLTEAKEPVWHMDPSSPDYADRLGRLLAALHSVTAPEAAAAGVEVRTAEQVRDRWREDIATVTAEFEVSAALAASWQEWLAEDSCWPPDTVMTHGEIYPAHVLLGEDGAITGVLDWTTARVDDPARDFSFQVGAAGEEMLQVTLEAYAEAGGTVHPGLAAQAARLWESSPIAYALFALTTRDEADLAAAAAMLQPSP